MCGLSVQHITITWRVPHTQIMPLPIQATGMGRLPGGARCCAQAPSEGPGRGLSAELTLLPNPNSGSSLPSTLRMETRRVHEWADARGVAHFQLELRLVNASDVTVPDVLLVCPHAEAHTLFNVRENSAAAGAAREESWEVVAAPAAGQRSFGLPAWLVEAGGLQSDGQLVFGGIFFTEAPHITAAPVS